MSAWGTSWGTSWANAWGDAGAPVPPVVVEEDTSGRWAGEWLPIPIPKQYQPPTPPKRKAKIHAKAPSPRGRMFARSINPVHASAVLIVNDGPISEIICRVDNTIPNEEETIIAAMAALL